MQVGLAQSLFRGAVTGQAVLQVAGPAQPGADITSTGWRLCRSS
jgi:hypothetical protein